jgi:hypothetical protein
LRAEFAQCWIFQLGGIAQKKRWVIDSRVSPPALFIIYMVFLQYFDVDTSTVEIIAASFFFLPNEVALLMPDLLFFPLFWIENA